jgi:DNA-binding transcriptional LysR family regulator
LLRVNAPMSFGTLQLGPALAEFMVLYPELRIHLVLSDEQIDPVQGGYDVTLRIADIESSSLIARKIVAIDRAICASPAYLQQHGTPKHPNELRSHALLTYGFLLTGNQWKLTGPEGDHWIQPEWTLCANNAEVLRDAAIAGRGVALLPNFIAGAALRDGALRSFLDEYRAPPLHFYAIYPPTRHLAVKVRLFIDFLVERFASQS